MDELSPLFQEIEFHERFRGYDPDEVDAYVDRVAKAAAVVRGRLTELHERVEAAESRGGGAAPRSEAEETLTRTLVLAQRTADAAIAEAREEADRLTSDAAAGAQAILSAAETEATAMVREAQSEAAATRKESEDRAARILAEAETDRRSIVAEAETAAAAAAAAERERLASEVAQLQHHRAFLADDIEILERHLDEERSRLSASLAALAEVLETPEAFRSARPPETSGVEVERGLLESDSETVGPDEAGEADEPAGAESVFADPTAPDDVEDPGTGSDGSPAGEASGESPAGVEQPDDDVETIDLVAAERATALVFEPEAGGGEPDEPDDAPIDLDGPWPDDEAEAEAEADPAYVGVYDLSAEASTIEAPPADPTGPPRLLTAADLDSAQTSGSRIGYDSGPPTAPHPTIGEGSLFDEPDDGDDPFLAQLRGAVDHDPVPENDDEALSAFFDQEEDDDGRSWFGRRR